MAKKHTLEKRPPGKRAAFVMREPNDNLDAYGWNLRWLRNAADDGTAGRPLFNLPLTIEEVRKYGPELQFIEPRYLQYMLEQQPEIQKALKKVRAAGYSPAALEKFTKLVVRVFEERVLVDIIQRVFKVAPLVAQFFAAKLAYEVTFGAEAASEPEDDEPPQIEAKTTKSRR